MRPIRGPRRKERTGIEIFGIDNISKSLDIREGTQNFCNFVTYFMTPLSFEGPKLKESVSICQEIIQKTESESRSLPHPFYTTLTEEDIEQDIYLRMAPAKRYEISLTIKSIKKGVPKIVEDDNY